MKPISAVLPRQARRPGCGGRRDHGTVSKVVDDGEVQIEVAEACGCLRSSINDVLNRSDGAKIQTIRRRCREG